MVFIIIFLYLWWDLLEINISCEEKIFKVQHFLQIYFNFLCWVLLKLSLSQAVQLLSRYWEGIKIFWLHFRISVTWW